VLAGTQGMRNHLKKDRLFGIAERRRLPVVLFAEGGGGRPGDVDWPHVAALDCRAFNLFARLSGLVSLVGIASGYCFAGNAALLGCCDVVIATEDSSIGMGGPAMIEGGGLGTHEPGEVGSDRRPVRQWRRRPAGQRRCRERRGVQALPLLLPGADRAGPATPTSGRCET
jgi:acetyl-CoA carboxylase carboxyltransferase component